MKTLTLIAILLLSFTVQAEWEAPKHSSDDMEETEELSTKIRFPHDDGFGRVSETNYIAAFECTKQKSGYSRLQFWILATSSDNVDGPYWDSRQSSVIIKVDDNAPFRMDFGIAGNHEHSFIGIALNIKLIQAFRAGNTARIRISDRRGNWEVKLDLAGFTRGSGPVIDSCG